MKGKCSQSTFEIINVCNVSSQRHLSLIILINFYYFFFPFGLERKRANGAKKDNVRNQAANGEQENQDIK